MPKLDKAKSQLELTEFELSAIRERGKSTVTTLSRHGRARNVDLMPRCRPEREHATHMVLLSHRTSNPRGPSQS